jgi:FlaA1/EpsC-like NDP-sugar epimerase
MSQTPQDNSEPFWMDDPYEPGFGSRSTIIFSAISAWINIIVLVLVMITIVLLISRPLAYLWSALFLLFSLRYFFNYRKVKLTREKAKALQAKAFVTTGASSIGSAIHVAGHPLLERDQAVVLALARDRISIFDYGSSEPIDTINVKDLTALHTVVYDDDRMPHIEVIDSAAQALQMTFSKDGKEITCLFKKMHTLRPIDWYHAIERARFMA